MNEATKQLAEENGLGAIRGITWTCHVCGDLRPDEKISVAKHIHILPGPGSIAMEHNVRYCNDRDDCQTAAMLRDHTALAFARLVKANDGLWESHKVVTKAARRALRLNWWFLGDGIALGAGAVIALAHFTTII